jgi:hypothetical protein
MQQPGQERTISNRSFHDKRLEIIDYLIWNGLAIINKRTTHYFKTVM